MWKKVLLWVLVGYAFAFLLPPQNLVGMVRGKSA